MKNKKINSENNQEISKDNPEQDYKDKYIRLLAEFTNYTKQKEEEIRGVVKFANKNILLKLIDIIDDIEAGLLQENTSEETKTILNINKNKLTQILVFEGVEEISISKGDSFDANTSEVIQTIEDPENSGKIIEVLRKGYFMSNMVLRTAKVIVGK